MMLLSLLLALNAHADLGPKPTMAFHWKAKGDVDLSSLKLLQCKDESCKDARPLEDAGPQHFSCAEEQCGALAYGFAEFNQLAGKTKKGKEVKSNVFKTNGMASEYSVTAKGAKLEVEEKK